MARYSTTTGADDTSLVPLRSQTLAISFECNNRCLTCLLGTLRGGRPAVSREAFTARVDENSVQGRYDRLILSGAEPTLSPDFLRLAEYARNHGGYKHIRVQSNGRKFKDAVFLQDCLAAGVDEYYISVKAHEASLEQRLSGEVSSHQELWAGLANLANAGATLITNTPVCSLNCGHLVDIAAGVSPFAPSRMEFYGFVPTTTAQRQWMIRAAELKACLAKVLTFLAAREIDSGICWVPACLLGAHRDRFAPELPETIIDADFWAAFPRFCCFYSAVCAEAPRCQGLSLPHIETYGWELDHLDPVLPDSVRPAESPEHGGELREPEEYHDLLAGADGRQELETLYYRLLQVRPSARMVQMDFNTPGAHTFGVTLEPKDPHRRCDMQTNSFNVTVVSTGRAVASPRDTQRFKAILLARLTRNDDGRLAFKEGGHLSRPCVRVERARR